MDSTSYRLTDGTETQVHATSESGVLRLALRLAEERGREVSVYDDTECLVLRTWPGGRFEWVAA